MHDYILPPRNKQYNTYTKEKYFTFKGYNHINVIENHTILEVYIDLLRISSNPPRDL